MQTFIRFLAATLVLCATATASIAGPYEVQMQSHMTGAENAADSYEIKCT